MDKKIKELYSITVNRKSKVKEKTKEIVDGNEREIISTVEKEIPIKYIVKKPSYSDKEDLDTFYAVSFNEFVKMGLLTRAMIAKKYNDTGGVLSEDEQKEYTSLMLEFYNTKNDITRLETLSSLNDNQKDKKEEALKKFIEIKQKMLDFETQKEELFKQTADYKARDKAILWCSLNLIYTQDLSNEESKPVILFPGNSFNEKKEKWEEKMELIEENKCEEDFIKAYIDLSFFIQFWYMGLVSDSVSFEKVKKDIEKENAEK